MKLKEFFLENPKAALAFSGGVDSSYLLYAAREAGADVRPYFIQTAFQPEWEVQDVQRLGAYLNIKITVLKLDVLSDSVVASNPADRCYYCKKALFTALKNHASEDGYTVLIDGTNASDSYDDRPGMKALAELGVRSPLRECGLTKADIRELSQKAGLFTWDKPSYSCLATRIPAGNTITRSSLSKIEAAEKQLMQMGFTDLRVRQFGTAARIQLPASQIQAAAARHHEIQERLSPFFSPILLDMKAR